jgi:two-component system sensor histidine kinase AlgZ
MHPLLNSRRGPLYLGLWILILALAVWAIARATGLDWHRAALALAPACGLEAFICLSPWYMVQGKKSLTPQVALNVLVASAVAGVCFAGLARIVDSQLDSLLPLLAGMGATLYLLSAGLHFGLISEMRQADAERRATEARSLARESELQALKFQLNPHFLFNSLHSIAALATQDGARAREMCIGLSEFLRATLTLDGRDSTPLGEELELTRRYLDIERIRFGARLQVREEIDADCGDCLVPALLLQPLIENAVKHGVAGLSEGGEIHLTAARDGAGVRLRVENAFDPEWPQPRGSGLGLNHVRRRLQARYGGAASLDAIAEGAVYRVELRLPCESPNTSSSRA